MFLNHRVPVLPTPDEALRGRDTGLRRPPRHTVLGNPLLGPYPEGLEIADFGLGCFWGAERKFWQTPGVWTTLVGYQGGHTPNPTYEEVCSGLTGHTEAVRVVFDPAEVSYGPCSRSSGSPTTPPRASARATTSAPSTARRSTPTPPSSDGRRASRDAYQKVLTGSGLRHITTEILPADGRPFYPAEAYHQQYLDKNPAGTAASAGRASPARSASLRPRIPRKADRTPVSVFGDRRIGEFGFREHSGLIRTRPGTYGLHTSHGDYVSYLNGYNAGGRGILRSAATTRGRSQARRTPTPSAILGNHNRRLTERGNQVDGSGCRTPSCTHAVERHPCPSRCRSDRRPGSRRAPASAWTGVVLPVRSDASSPPGRGLPPVRRARGSLVVGLKSRRGPKRS